MALAAGVTPAGSPPPPDPAPLSISMSSTAGSIINVSGSSGSRTVINYSPSGGSGGYTVTAGASNMGSNPSGKLSQGNPSNPSGSGTITISWTGFALNELQSATFGCSVTSGAAFASAGLGLSIKRTS